MPSSSSSSRVTCESFIHKLLLIFEASLRGLIFKFPVLVFRCIDHTYKHTGWKLKNLQAVHHGAIHVEQPYVGSYFTVEGVGRGREGGQCPLPCLYRPPDLCTVGKLHYACIFHERKHELSHIFGLASCQGLLYHLQYEKIAWHLFSIRWLDMVDNIATNGCVVT